MTEFLIGGGLAVTILWLYCCRWAYQRGKEKGEIETLFKIYKKDVKLYQRLIDDSDFGFGMRSKGKLKVSKSRSGLRMDD